MAGKKLFQAWESAGTRGNVFLDRGNLFLKMWTLKKSVGTCLKLWEFLFRAWQIFPRSVGTLILPSGDLPDDVMTDDAMAHDVIDRHEIIPRY